jgi:hypothetical protein
MVLSLLGAGLPAGEAWAEEEPAAAEAPNVPAPSAEPAADHAPSAAATAEPHHDPAPAPGAAHADEDDEHAFKKAHALGEAEQKVLADVLEKKIQDVKEHVLDKMETKMEEKQAKKMGKLSSALALFSLTGLLLLLMPLFLRKSYPGKGAVLAKASALAAGAAVVAINLFAAVIVLLKGVQGAMGAKTNPVLKIVEASFDVLADQVHEMFAFGPTIIQPTLDQLSGDTDEPMPVVLLMNVQRLGKAAAAHVDTFKSVAEWFIDMRWILEYVPAVLMFVTLALFAVAAKPVLVELVKLPGRAASGDEGATKAALKLAGARILHELFAVGCLIGFLIAFTEVSETVLSISMYPAVNEFLDYFFMNLIYIQEDAHASGGLILGSLGGTLAFLVLNIAVVTLSGAFYLGKIHKIFQARFHDAVPLKAHASFWKWGTLAALWTVIFPLLYIEVAERITHLLEKDAEGKDPSWTFLLLSGPVLMVAGFLVAFWAVRGLKGMGFLLKYNVKNVADAYLAAQPAAVPAAAE